MPPRLPRTTWIPGEGPRPDDAWLHAIDADLLVEVGALLFDRGQGFEAHEAWELAWKQAKARGDVDAERTLRALIKLAAAMVKVRQETPAGVRAHLRGAVAVLEEVHAADVCGVRTSALLELARGLERDQEQIRPRPVGEPVFGKIPRSRPS